jgi:hypothetical protein
VVLSANYTLQPGANNKNRFSAKGRVAACFFLTSSCI